MRQWARITGRLLRQLPASIQPGERSPSAVPVSSSDYSDTTTSDASRKSYSYSPSRLALISAPVAGERIRVPDEATSVVDAATERLTMAMVALHGAGRGTSARECAQVRQVAGDASR
ncbi:hypothetical protein A9K55_006472 [Cordyceps militaris]|uniref:Uncharacterized protein n=1 Tax=Cordyceps militaris TaxID=73501 RepID=A0A2H4SD37_CORMI|nr:hypothetical protein A9K55_006472 [Cordyceps militaris]